MVMTTKRAMAMATRVVGNKEGNGNVVARVMATATRVAVEQQQQGR